MKTKFKDGATVLLGVTLCGFAEGIFLFRQKLVSGGFSGIANILFNTAGLPPAMVVPILNLAVSLVALRTLGKSFIVKTAVTNLAYSFVIQLFSSAAPITDDRLTCCLLGGAIGGIGTALIMSRGATRGGTDIIARFVQNKRPEFPIGTFLLILDGSVILASLLIFRERELALFGMLTLIVETGVVDIVIRRFNRCSTLMIVTEREDEVRSALLAASERGMTLLEGKGAYTGERKGIVIICVKNREVARIYDTARNTDPDAFIINLLSNEVSGYGFEIYR